MAYNKTLYRSSLILSFIALNALILLGIGAVWSYLNSGADRASVLQLPLRERRMHQQVSWEEGHPVFEAEGAGFKRKVERDYLNAWDLRNKAFAANEPEMLRSHYTDSALSKLSGLIRLNRSQGIQLQQINLSHVLRPLFLSADKTLLVLEDRSAELYRKYVQGQEMLSESTSSEALQLVLLLEDGFWRIRQMRAVERAARPDAPSSGSKSENAAAESLETAKSPAEAIHAMRGVNYYPQRTPWDHFGQGYDGEQCSADLRLLREMGGNTLRIFVPYEAFGGPAPAQAPMAALMDFMDRAHAERIRVLVTLFDFYGDYRPEDWPATFRHAERLVRALSGHPALLGWDLKNEPDLDFKARGRETVLAWLKALSQKVRAWDPEHPITIGWSDAAAATGLQDSVDFISFHYYGAPADFAEVYQGLEQKVNKPVLLEECGRSSYGGIWSLFRGSEAAQEAYYRELLAGLEETGVPYLAWTLYDFEEVPASVVGRLPWRKAPQRHFGVMRADGSAKPALEPLKAALKREGERP